MGQMTQPAVSQCWQVRYNLLKIKKFTLSLVILHFRQSTDNSSVIVSLKAPARW